MDKVDRLKAKIEALKGERKELHGHLREIVKADDDDDLDRLGRHIDAARTLLAQG